MELKDYRMKILTGQICPYCNGAVKQVSEFEIYGREYRGRVVHVCVNYPICNSYVGSHEDKTPLGRLADKELREWKEIAHKYFDPLWREEYLTRDEAYEKLAKQLSIPKEETHIGMFDIKDCRMTVKWSVGLYNDLKERNHDNIN